MKKTIYFSGAILILLVFIFENCGSRSSCPAYGYAGSERITERRLYPWNSNKPSKSADMVSSSESYDSIPENNFIFSEEEPVSTFSADVDRASYSNIRRFLTSGQKPPSDAVRIEEMINYFHYDYEQPKENDPVKIVTELAECPWNEGNQLLLVALQGKNISYENLPASNLVFLVDVSGSMNSPDRLPLLKSSFELLVNNLRAKDKISIVVYAGAAGLVLPATNGNEKTKIMEAINNLSAGGSTAGGAGINLAYSVAQANFIAGGNNRVILATDGDFNVGVSSDSAMETLIVDKRKSNIFLTCLGFGRGNLKDSKMEKLADKGNGNYSYIDNINEAKKVLITEFGGTMYAIAKDVKIQIQFNSENVKAYRLIGYENRMLRKEDFTDDKKDAGEMGSGHTVTAIYEIIPAGIQSVYIKDEQGIKKRNQDPLEKIDRINMGV
ncbi:MAG: von Willebrand factor type A domain-containing protein, partial [Bacteroidia bacterium]|nr:von Willebrand factor type A domain-containing protein [Bacteroidia bacterium]